jgi:hypothetical protein
MDIMRCIFSRPTYAIGGLAVLVVGIVVAAYVGQRGGTQSTQYAIAALRAAYDGPTGEQPGTKADWGARWSAVGGMVRFDAGNQEAALAFLGAGVWKPADRGFVGTLECVLLTALIEGGDNVRLRRFLASIPTVQDGPDGAYIEFAIVDPLLTRPVESIFLLFDAYDDSKSSVVRGCLVAAIRRAFWDKIKPWWTDEEVVERCRREYRYEVSDWKVNPAYRLADHALSGNMTNWEPPPLFIPKNGPEEVRGRIRDRGEPR